MDELQKKLISKAVGLAMNRKVRLAVKVITGLMWIMTKGIDMYEDFTNTLDTELLIDRKVKKEVRNEIACVMKSNGAQEEKIAKFLASLPE